MNALELIINSVPGINSSLVPYPPQSCDSLGNGGSLLYGGRAAGRDEPTSEKIKIVHFPNEVENRTFITHIETGPTAPARLRGQLWVVLPTSQPASSILCALRMWGIYQEQRYC